MITNSILITIQIAWAWLWTFVKSGCKSILQYDTIMYKKINSKKNRDSKLVKEIKKASVSILVGLCFALFPLIIYGLVFGVLYAIALLLWRLASWIVISILPAQLLFAANIATWIVYLFLPFVIVLHLVWRFFRGGPAGLEDDEVADNLISIMHKVISNSKSVIAKYCVMPMTKYAIFDKTAFRGRYQKEHTLVLHVQLREGVELTANTLHYIKNALQAKIDEELDNGVLDGLPWAVDDVWVKVVRVYADNFYLYMELILVRHNQAKLALWNADVGKMPLEVDDEDDVFGNSDN